MQPLNVLPVYLLILLSSLDISLAHQLQRPTHHESISSYIPKVLHKVRTAAAVRTHRLARDLRVAFGGVLVRRDDSNPASTAGQPRHVVYCKSSQQNPLLSSGDGGLSGNTSNPNGPSTSTSTRSSSSSRGGSSTRPPSGNPTNTPIFPPSQWKLIKSYAGNNFLDGWDFFTRDDPTHGLVDYVDEAAARSSGILELNGAGNIVMRVETTPTVQGNRKSIRLEGKDTFNGGLLTMDAIHMPTGCGIWPAFWTNGPTWPVTGEIDIIEGVHDYTNNQATIHADVGCTLPTTSANTLGISGTVIANTDCAAETTGNQGCGVRAATSNSFGQGFNSAGGGTYAMTWDSTGIAIWFFPRGSEPSDIGAQAPNPDGWGAPMARWPASTCDPYKFFVNHHAIFDTTLCGDWAGAVWNVAGIPGQEQSCAQRTGVATCEEFVRTRGASMANAYWEVRSVKLYQAQ